MSQMEYYYNEHDENQVNKILKAKKKKRLKKRIKILLFLVLIALITAFFVSDASKVKSIHIVGNQDIKDSEILDCITIDEDTIYLFIDKKAISQQIKDIGMIKKASVSVDLLGNIKIDIEEALKVAYSEVDQTIYVIDELGGIRETDDASIIESLLSCPRITGFEDIELLKTFAKEYVNIPELIKNQTSDIIYSPKKSDETRLEFIMDNGKIFYLRIEDMVEQLERIDYEAFMTGYSDRCVFSFEGKYIYTEKCE